MQSLPWWNGGFCFTLGFMRRLLLAVLLIGVSCKSPTSPATSSTAKPPSTAPGSAAASVPTAPTSSSTAVTIDPMPFRPLHSGPVKPRPMSTGAIAISDSAVQSEAASGTTPDSVGLPTAEFGASGKLVIRNYPKPLERGMIDWATYVGYSKDGKQVGSCGIMAPLTAKGGELANVCYVHDGTTTQRVTLDQGAQGYVVGRSLANVFDWLKEGAAVSLSAQVVANVQYLSPPKIDVEWKYASEIELDLQSGEPKIGGRVGKEEPVFPVKLSIKSDGLAYSGMWNAVLAHPMAQEFAFIAHFYCREWCNEELIARLSHDQLASLIFNDTGFRHHQKKAFAQSRDFFLKATRANPRAPLPPYNLACAYAQLGDATNAERALRLAIALGGDRVKARAQKDADFKSMLQTTWFKSLTR
jgi:hypothetical protein